MTNFKRLVEASRSAGVDALLLTNPASVTWATGFSGSFGNVLLKGEDALFITDSRYAIQAQEEVTEMPSAVFSSPVRGIDFIGQKISELSITRLWLESDFVTLQQLSDYKKAWSGVEFENAPPLVGKLRMIKSPEEVEKIRKACQLVDEIFVSVCRLIQPGATEYDINLEIEFRIRRHGAEIAFAPIVVSGANSAKPHGHATEKKLAVGDFVTMDFGAKLDGYCSDLTRTVVVAEASPRHQEVYGQVLKAQLAALRAMKPGVSAAQVDAEARMVLDEIGLAKYFGHGLGHGLGRLVHDSGGLRPGSEDILEPGQVWTVEPGVYIEGFGGVRIEDDVVVTTDGIEILTHCSKELMVLP